MPSTKKYFIDSYGLRALYIDKDAHVREIVKGLMNRNIPIHTSDFVIQMFVQDMLNDGKDPIRIKAELKKVQMAGFFKLVKPLTEEEFTNAKVRFEGLDDYVIPLLEWTVLESMVRNGCNVLISSKDRYKAFEQVAAETAPEFLSVEILPKYGK